MSPRKLEVTYCLGDWGKLHRGRSLWPRLEGYGELEQVEYHWKRNSLLERGKSETPECYVPGEERANIFSNLKREMVLKVDRK